MIKKWWFKPAKFWQFWLPQSGILGAMIFVIVVFWIPYHVFR